MGLQTVADVRAYSARSPGFLSDAQRIGVDLFEHFQLRIPRHEVEEIFAKVQAGVAAVRPGTVAVCGGSYRRGQESCGDVDVLLYTDTAAEAPVLLGELVRRLHTDGLLTHDLGRGGRFGNAAPERSATYLGVCRVGDAYRRIDIKVSDPQQHLRTLSTF